MDTYLIGNSPHKGDIMKKMGGAILVGILSVSVISLINPVSAINTIPSSTMIFEGLLTDLGGERFTGGIYGR